MEQELSDKLLVMGLYMSQTFQQYALVEPKPSKSSIPVTSSYAHSILQNTSLEHRALKSEYPTLVISTHLFGSVERGEPNPNDIDLYVLFNDDELRINLLERMSHLQELRTEQRESVLRIYTDRDAGDIANRLEDRLRKKGYKCDAFPHLISFDQIGRLVDNMIESQSFEKVDDTLLSIMLHFSLDAAIYPYRAFLFDKLSNLGNLGQRVWERVKGGYEYWVNPERWNAELLKYEKCKVREYPTALKDARVFFGV